jgi:hypothetical protein
MMRQLSEIGNNVFTVKLLDIIIPGVDLQEFLDARQSKYTFKLINCSQRECGRCDASYTEL